MEGGGEANNSEGVERAKESMAKEQKDYATGECLFTAWLNKWMDILVIWFFKGGQMLQGEEIEGLILQAIRWILEGELRFLINKNFLGEWCVRRWKTSSVLVKTPSRCMKVAKTLIESMPGKGDFHAEEIWEWSSVSPSAAPYQQDGPGLSGIYGSSDYDPVWNLFCEEGHIIFTFYVFFS